MMKIYKHLLQYKYNTSRRVCEFGHLFIAMECVRSVVVPKRQRAIVCIEHMFVLALVYSYHYTQH